MIHVHVHPHMSVLLRGGGYTLDELYMFTVHCGFNQWLRL